MSSMAFFEYEQKSKMIKLIEKDCPNTKVRELP
jgi:hypothetical protein